MFIPLPASSNQGEHQQPAACCLCTKSPGIRNPKADFARDSRFSIVTLVSIVAAVGVWIPSIDQLRWEAPSTDPIAILRVTLTHISTSAEIALGVIAQAVVNVPGAGNLQDEAKHTVLSTAFDLPTGCVGYDVAAKTYGAVDTTASMATGTETAAAGAKPSQSVGSLGVLGVENSGLGRGMMAFVALVGVCTDFALFW